MSTEVQTTPLCWALGVRFPRWEPSWWPRLLAAGIDPFRPPPERVEEPVDVCVMLAAPTEFAARERLREALPEISLTPFDFPVPAITMAGLPDPHEERDPGGPPWLRY